MNERKVKQLKKQYIKENKKSPTKGEFRRYKKDSLSTSYPQKTEKNNCK